MGKLESSDGGLFGGKRLEFRSGKSKAARKSSQAQQDLVRSQQQKESLRKADAEDELGRKKVAAKGKTAGRSLLTATSPTGGNNLGG